MPYSDWYSERLDFCEIFGFGFEFRDSSILKVGLPRFTRRSPEVGASKWKKPICRAADIYLLFQANYMFRPFSWRQESGLLIMWVRIIDNLGLLRFAQCSPSGGCFKEEKALCCA